jgi:hypothetical protein
MRQVRYPLTEELGCPHRPIPPFLRANVWFSTRKQISAAKVTRKYSCSQHSHNDGLWNGQGAPGAPTHDCFGLNRRRPQGVLIFLPFKPDWSNAVQWELPGGGGAGDPLAMSLSSRACRLPRWWGDERLERRPIRIRAGGEAHTRE